MITRTSQKVGDSVVVEIFTDSDTKKVVRTQAWTSAMLSKQKEALQVGQTQQTQRIEQVDEMLEQLA